VSPFFFSGKMKFPRVTYSGNLDICAATLCVSQ
jgi:hypothetical protein